MSVRRKLTLGPRNDPLGMAQRSWINLELIERTFKSKKEGHVVTQLVQSLLALLVFPKEAKLFELFKRWRLSDMQKSGQTLPVIMKDDEDDTKTLFDLLRHMRNSVCHGLVTFYGEGSHGSESRNLDEIRIEFADRNEPTGPIDWLASIEGDQLRNFLLEIKKIIFD
jgi:hypothetical protein